MALTNNMFDNGELDLNHVQEVVTGISAKDNVTPVTESTDRFGQERDTLPELLKKVGWYSVGVWASNPFLTKPNEYVFYNNQRFTPLSLPYQVDSTTHPDPNALVPSELRDVSQFLTSYNLSEYTNLSFPTINDADASGLLKVGDFISTEDYAAGNEAGTLFFRVVAPGTGVHDGGKYIDLPTSGLQLEQNLKYPYSVKAWGGGSNSSTTVNNAAFQNLMDFAVSERAANRLITVLDLAGDSYDISEPIVIRSSGLKFQYGVINQTVNIKDGMQTDGSLNTIYYLELDRVDINILGAPLPNQFSGSNFRHLTGTLGWFKWQGLNTIMKQGEHGFSNGYGVDTGEFKGGPIWMLQLERLWFNNGWSSSLFIPSNGGSFSLTDFDGGSTTYRISNVHTTYIQTASPAYRLGNGIDHVTLDTVTADHCTKFGEFKVKSLIMRNIAMEEIRPPADDTAKANFYAAQEHNLILVGQQQSLDLSGFTTAFGSELQDNPHQDTNHVATDSVNSKITGVIGGTVSTGRALRISGGNCVVDQNNVPGALPDRIINGARVNYQTQQRFVSSTSKNNTFDLFDVDPNQSRAYLVTLIYEFDGNSSTNTFICHTAGTAGGLKGNTALLLGAIDFTGATLQVTGGKVQATVPSNTFVNWSAVDLTKL